MAFTGIVFIVYYNPEKLQNQSQDEKQNTNIVQNSVSNNFIYEDGSSTNATLTIQIGNTPYQNGSLPISITYTNFLIKPTSGMTYFYVKSTWSNIDLSQIKNVFSTSHWVYEGRTEPLKCDDFTFDSNYMCIQGTSLQLLPDTKGFMTTTFEPMMLNQDGNGTYHIKVQALYDSKIILPQKAIIISDKTQQYTTYYHWDMSMYDISFKIR